MKNLRKNPSPRAYSRIKSPKTFTYERLKQMLKENPFDVVPDNELLEANEVIVEEEKKKLKAKSQLSLVKRALPYNLPPLQDKGKENQNGEEEIKPVAPERQRKQQMNGLVDQTREILLSQIKIDRKRKEIQRIKQLQKTEKAQIEKEISKIAETGNQYEMTANGIKAQLDRAHSEMERALIEKQEMQRTLKKKKDNIAKIKAEITKNEDIVFQSRNYAEFLKSMTPEGEDALKYFWNPEVLTNEMDKLEEENLFLIRKCREFEQQKERNIDMIKGDLEEAECELNQINEAAKKVTSIEPISFDKTQLFQSINEIEKERMKLARVVEKAYLKCFSIKAEMTPVMMLEKIENGLEKLYLQVQDITDHFVIEEQLKIDKQRREAARILKQQQSKKERKMKRDAAYERATKPVQKKMGRPLRTRILPVTFHRTDNKDRKLLDEKLQEEFLFGPIVL